MVRNSIGPDAYVADELIVSRAGIRIRVGNTDAEGRMAMVDLLAYLKEQVLANKWANAQLFTVATLTGHACLVSGNYTMVMDNGPARLAKVAQRIIEAGERVGDCCELSTIRREDYEFCKGKSEYEQVLQCNNAASSRTPRGHQFPAAFLAIVSGLDKHGIDSTQPIGYTHVDIAASSGPFPGKLLCSISLSLSLSLALYLSLSHLLPFIQKKNLTFNEEIIYLFKTIYIILH
jgi:leucyl aminopeptidase